MSNPVVPTYQYYAKPDQGRPVFSGYIYIGQAGTDPSIPENQIQVRQVQPDGSEVAVTQPLQLSPGGLILVNDEPAKIVADSSFSIAVYGKNGVLQTFDPNSYPDQKCVIGPGGSTDPNPGFATIVNSLDPLPITWIRGYRGIVNDGTGQPAVWADYNGQSENDNGLIGGLDTASSVVREILNPDPTDDWFLTLTDPPVIQVGGQGATAQEDNDIENRWDNVFNVGLYNSTVEAVGPFGLLPYGWPVSWKLRGYNVYNQSTDPAVPTVDPANADYRIRDGDSGGTLVFQVIGLETTSPNGPSVSMPQRSGVDIFYAGGIYMQNAINLKYAFEAGNAPFTNGTSVYSAQCVTPKNGQIAVHEMGQQTDHTVSAYFQFKLDHPLGVDIDAEQIIWAAGEVRLYVEKDGTIKFQPEDGIAHTVGTVAVDDFAVVVIQQDVTSSPPNRIHRGYLNGVETLNIAENFWRPDLEPSLWTGGDWRGASAPVAVANRRAMVAGFSEYVMWDALIEEADILAMANELLGN